MSRFLTQTIVSVEEPVCSKVLRSAPLKYIDCCRVPRHIKGYVLAVRTRAQDNDNDNAEETGKRRIQYYNVGTVRDGGHSRLQHVA